MRVPTRKPGQYSHLRPDPHLRPEKVRELERKLERLRQRQPAAIEEVKRLASDGDFSENAAYQIAKGRLRGLNRRIDEIEDHLRRAEVIETPTDTSRVRLGHKVTVEVGGRQKIYQILGSAEIDPDRGVISHNSPLGAALLGRSAGDKITVRMKDREIEYRILKIDI